MLQLAAARGSWERKRRDAHKFGRGLSAGAKQGRGGELAADELVFSIEERKL